MILLLFFNKKYYIKRLAYRIQELAYGINEKLEQRLDALVKQNYDKNAGKQIETHRPVVGTKLLREWKGVEHIVTVREDCFEHKGIRYRSLSAVAKNITGTTWNGLVFFGLKRMGGSK